MEHETKNEDHQTREDEVADEVANFWCTWMSEIPTKLEKMGQHLLSNTPWKKQPELGQMVGSVSERKKARADL